jgi:hypothetical protein
MEAEKNSNFWCGRYFGRDREFEEKKLSKGEVNPSSVSSWVKSFESWVESNKTSESTRKWYSFFLLVFLRLGFYDMYRNGTKRLFFSIKCIVSWNDRYVVVWMHKKTAYIYIYIYIYIYTQRLCIKRLNDRCITWMRKKERYNWT